MGRAWWPVDLVTWAAPAGPVAVVPGAQLFAPRLMSTCAVIRSQVSAWCAVIRGPGDLARGPRPVTWWPLRTGPRPGAGDLVALGRVAWFVITCARLVAGVCDPVTWCRWPCAQVSSPRPGGRDPRAVARALVAG